MSSVGLAPRVRRRSCVQGLATGLQWTCDELPTSSQWACDGLAQGLQRACKGLAKGLRGARK
eukprot:1957975-Alexandrium_andersonii.AAC.1